MDNNPDATQDDSVNEEFLNTPIVTETDDTPISTDEETAEGTDQSDVKPEEDNEKGDVKSTDETKEAEAPAEEPQAEAPEKGKPDPEIARQLYLERQRTRQEIAKQIDQNYAPKAADDFLNEEEGLTPEQAELKAIREEIAFERQRGAITELNATLQTEAVNVEADYGVYNPKSPDYDKDFTTMVEGLYQQASNLQIDENGLVLRADVPLYDFYKQMAEVRSSGATKDQERRQAEAIQQASRTEIVGGSSSTNDSKDPQEDFLEKYGNLPIV